MQQTFLNILKKYFNVVKALAYFFFCLVGYIWTKSIKDDAVLAMIKRVKIPDFLCCFFLFLFLNKENAVIYYYYRQIKKRY